MLPTVINETKRHTSRSITVLLEMTSTDLVHSRIISPSLAGKFSVCWSLFPGHPPGICSCLIRSHRLSWDPRWSRGITGWGSAGPLPAVVHSLEVEGVRPGCLVFKDHLE